MRANQPWTVLAVAALCGASSMACATRSGRVPSPTSAGNTIGAGVAVGDVKSFEGYAEWRRDDALIVDGRIVLPAVEHAFKGKAEARDFDTIPLGYEVKVEAEARPDGTWLARKVEARPNGSAMFEQDVRSDFDAMEDAFLDCGWVFDVDHHGHRMHYGGLITDGPDVEYLRALVERLLPPYLPASLVRIYLVDNPEWNLLAAPNGAVFVNTGVLETVEEEDELALVLGRELAHMTHEHARRRAKKAFWGHLVMLGGLAITDHIETDVGRDVARALAVIGGIAVQARYDRKCEEQAERVGQRYALEAGYQPHGGGAPF